MAAPPGDHAPPPPGEPSGGPSHRDPHRDIDECSAGVSPPPGVERRCVDHRPCVEVIARLIAADKADRVFHDDAAARQLRVTAGRFAERHRFGMPDEADVS